MAKDIQSERSPGPRSRWAVTLFATAWIGIFGGMGLVMGACGKDDDDISIDRSQRTDYDPSWHTIKVTTPEGDTLTCVVSDFREGVWCK